MSTIYAIHGAFSSPRIFNFIKKTMGSHYTWRYLDYHDITGGISDIINEVRDVSPEHLVGHSMGGLIALALAARPWVKSITTIAAPMGGIDVNLFQSYLTRSRFINEIASHTDFISGLKKSQISKPVQHLVSTLGFNPYIYEPNDGVVTIRSQMAVSFGEVYTIEANHTEIMLDTETSARISAFVRSNE